MSAKVRKAKGKRYTYAERREIFNFIDRFNALHRKGGQTAASRHFNVAMLTIQYWRNGNSRTGPVKKSASENLIQLRELQVTIARLEKNLRAWRREFDWLKASL